jgi:BirA family transcriptional regulator, biotin operon repressor / biotin---[acetyl-CoA-carboxylase] ligase
VSLGRPRLHLRSCASTNDRARELALGGAPHGTLVTADEQTSGRGRQGRRWSAPAGRALLMSLVLREFDPLLPLRAGNAVADVAGTEARVKWPNDVWLGDRRKVAGILVEGRPLEGWAVAGIGLNVAVRPGDLPPELRDLAAGMGREPADVEGVLADLVAALERRLTEPAADALEALRARDALRDRRVAWAGGQGTAAGIDDQGRLLVRTGTEQLALDAGEVHLRV